MKIRCSRCRKRISIDEAFAGAVCRCPYCEATVFVPGKVSLAAGGRDETAQARPETPAEIAAGAKAPAAVRTAIAGGEVPLARPVMIQGVVSIVLTGLLVVVMGGMALLIAFPRSQPAPTQPDKIPPPATPSVPPAPQVGPFTVGPEGPTVAGDVRIETPVIYCLDAGGGMRNVFDFAVWMTRASLKSLRKDDRFSVMACMEDEDKLMPGHWRDADQAGRSAAKRFLEPIERLGATDLDRALRAAVALKPKTIVLFTNKPVDADRLAKTADAGGVRIVAISLDGDSETDASLARLAKAAGGEFRTFSFSRLQRDLRGAGALD